MHRHHLRLLLFALSVHAATAEEPGPFADPRCPFLESSVDARDWGPTSNLIPRGLIVKLPHRVFVCYDTDLMRIAAAWVGPEEGPFLEETGTEIAFTWRRLRKLGAGQKNVAKPIGRPFLRSGVVPGLLAACPDLVDPRTPTPSPEENGRGPVPGCQFLQYDPTNRSLTWRVGDFVVEETLRVEDGHLLRSLSGVGKGAIEVVLGLVDDPEPSCDGPVMVRNGHRVATLAPGTPLRIRCPVKDLPADPGEVPNTLPDRHFEADFEPLDQPGAGPFVLESLPIADRIVDGRRVRPSDVTAGVNKGLAVVTADGEVWIVQPKGATTSWQQVGGGLNEPQGIQVVGCVPHVFSRGGISFFTEQALRQHSAWPAQTAETREFANALVAEPDGSFLVSKGGQRNGTLAKHSGRVLRVSPDGREVEVVASGLRQPFVARHPKTGLITCTDQQGHYVPATPLRIIEPGSFHGFKKPAPRKEHPPITEPLLWMPHPVCQSALGQVWAVDARLGPLNDRLLVINFNQSQVLQVFLDPDHRQGAVHRLPWRFPGPLLKGCVGGDGHLYLAGFNSWGTVTTERAGFYRVRWDGEAEQAPWPAEVRGFKQGLYLRFHTELPADAADLARWRLKRWNYLRGPGYGSPHYRRDGSKGQEEVWPSAARVSRDGKAVFLVVPDMRVVHQMEARWSLSDREDAAWLTLHHLPEFEAVRGRFDGLDGDLLALPPVVQAAAEQDRTVSAERGQATATAMGCLACHSTDGGTEGKVGPTWKGLAGSERNLAGGGAVKADAAYLRESILDPQAKRVEGVAEDTGMPAYAGILTEAQIDSLVKYIESLGR